jgi:hypothetical protein
MLIFLHYAEISVIVKKALPTPPKYLPPTAPLKVNVPAPEPPARILNVVSLVVPAAI